MLRDRPRHENKDLLEVDKRRKRSIELRRKWKHRLKEGKSSQEPLKSQPCRHDHMEPSKDYIPTWDPHRTQFPHWTRIGLSSHIRLAKSPVPIWDPYPGTIWVQCSAHIDALCELTHLTLVELGSLICTVCDRNLRYENAFGLIYACFFSSSGCEASTKGVV